MRIPLEALVQHRRAGPWRKILNFAEDLTAQVRRLGGESFSPQLGGGTRLMLALAHRISDDIDLFIDSPAWLGYVSPRLNDSIETSVQSYRESNDSVKLILPQGEIDFIVSTNLLPRQQALWNPPAADAGSFPLQPPAEVLARKLYFRGWALTARDLFDWWAIESLAPLDSATRDDLAQLLSTKQDEIANALRRLESNPLAALEWDRIRSPVIPDREKVVAWAQDALVDLAARRQRRQDEKKTTAQRPKGQ